MRLFESDSNSSEYLILPRIHRKTKEKETKKDGTACYSAAQLPHSLKDWQSAEGF